MIKYIARPFFRFTSFPINNMQDISNIQTSLIKYDQLSNYQPFFSKLAMMSPSNIYNELDFFSRDALVYLANDLNLGMGLSIAAVSVGIKFAFMPLQIMAQLNGMKMKLLDPETKSTMAKIQAASKKGDMASAKQGQLEIKAMRKHYGISSIVPMLSMLQIPILVTWFLSLRYVTTLPDIYPGLRTEGLFWFRNLSEYDPYFVLPLLSSMASYTNISLNPNLSSMGVGTIFGKYARYVKFLPFFSLPIVVFFPSAINLYWMLSAFMHLFVTMLIRNEKTRVIFGIPKYLPGSMLERQFLQTQTQVIKAIISQDTNQIQEGNIKSTDLKNGQSVQVFLTKPKKQKK